MSARQQAGRLRSLIARKLRQLDVAESMADALEYNLNKVTGNLEESILRTDPNRVFNISYRIDKTYDVMLLESVYVDLTRYFENAPYARFLHEDNNEEVPKVSTQVIADWIAEKINTPYWNSPFGEDFVVKSKGKVYFYDLHEPKYQRALGYVISTIINESGFLKSRTDFTSQALLAAEAAVIEAQEDFMEIWEYELVDIIDAEINAVFQ